MLEDYKENIEKQAFYVTPRHELSARCPVPDLRSISNIKERCKAAKEWTECRKRVAKEIEERRDFNGW